MEFTGFIGKHRTYIVAFYRCNTVYYPHIEKGMIPRLILFSRYLLTYANYTIIGLKFIAFSHDFVGIFFLLSDTYAVLKGFEL